MPPGLVESAVPRAGRGSGQPAARARARAAETRRSSSFADGEKSAGQYGGTLRILGGSSKDTRTLVVYGYARLVGYNPHYDIVPDIAESVEVEEGRKFTFHLRPGHRWSDGEPFTSEDFRYYWEDIVSDPEMSRFGAPQELLVEGEKPIVTFPDATTVRLHLVEAEPLFPAGAGRRAAFGDLPALALPEAVPRQICRARDRDEDGGGGGGAELGRAPLQQGPLLPERQYRAADACSPGS